MIINFKFIRILFIISFFLFFPFIQKQWFNLYLFGSNNFSFYSILYYSSGLFIPILVSLSSLKYFTKYKFNIKSIEIYSKKNIKGKGLLFIVIFFLILLSILIVNYFYINIDLLIRLIIKKNYLTQINFLQQFYFILILSILLIFRQTKILIKKLILVNFLTISLMIWYSHINKIIISDIFFINNYLPLENLNYINIIFLMTIESIYYLWSYLSYKENISDWNVPIPSKENYLFIFRIVFFYLFILFYYSITY